MTLDLRFELLKALRACPVILRGLLDSATDDQIRHRPDPTSWSVIEVAAHMTDTDERALGRVRRMLAEEDPALPGFDQEALAIERDYLSMDLNTVLDQYEEGRCQHLKVLEALDDAGWRRTGSHEVNGAMSIELYESHVACEDVDHLAQVSRLIGATRGKSWASPI